MTRFWAIFRTTFLQCVRQPIYGILILVTLAVLLLNLPMAGWTMGTDYHVTDQKFMENLGLSTLLMTGLLLAVFTASSALSKEIENRTALTVAAKPVGRATFVLGKFAGVSASVALAYYLCTLGFLMLVRHKVMPAASDPYDWPVIVIGSSTVLLSLLLAGVANYLFGWSFIPALVWIMTALMSVGVAVIGFIGPNWAVIPFGEGIAPEVLVGVQLTFLGVLTFCAVAVAASTRLGQAPTLLICFAVFLAGSAHPFLLGRRAEGHLAQWLVQKVQPDLAHSSFAKEVYALRVAGWVAPNLSYSDTSDQLAQGLIIPRDVVLYTMLYFALSVAGVLSFGVCLYQGRELEANTTSSGMPRVVGLLASVGRVVALGCGLIGLVILSAPALYTVRGLAYAAGLIVGAVAGWVLWTAFGRGRAWSRWVVTVGDGAGVAMVLSALLFGWPEIHWLGAMPLRVAILAIGIAVFVSLWLPKTRFHFASSQESADG